MFLVVENGEYKEEVYKKYTSSELYSIRLVSKDSEGFSICFKVDLSKPNPFFTEDGREKYIKHGVGPIIDFIMHGVRLVQYDFGKSVLLITNKYKAEKIAIGLTSLEVF